MAEKFKASKSYCTKNINWLDEIMINVSADLEDMINNSAELLEKNKKIMAVTYDVPQGIWDEECFKLMNKINPVDTQRIHVFGQSNIVLEIRGTKDCSEQAEYDLSTVLKKPTKPKEAT